MSATVRGRDAISRYLAQEWSLDELWNWALTFGDLREDRSDEETVSLALHVVAWVSEMQHGDFKIDVLNTDLATLVSSPTEAIAPRS